MLESLWQDTRQALRRLLATPGFTITAVLIVAVAIGANSAVFTVVNELLLRPRPFDRPERLVDIYQDDDDGEPSSNSFPAYQRMVAYRDVFQGVAAYSPATAALQSDQASEPVAVEFVTASYLPVLGLGPALGRWFDASEDAVGAAEVAVVSHRTWERRFGSDPAILGSTVRLNGRAVTLVGVGPREYHGATPGLNTDFWLSISATPVGGAFRVQNLERNQDHWYQVKARLAEGVTVARAQAAMDQLAAQLAGEFPDMDRGREITVYAAGDVRIHPEVDPMLAPVAALIMAVVGLVLLVACANLANLLLARGAGRATEVSVRLALGASRRRVAGHLLLESMLIALAGGAVGLWLAWGFSAVLPGLGDVLPVPGTLEVAPDGRVLAFAVMLTALTGLAFGLLPALQATRGDVAAALRADGHRTSGGRHVGALRKALVAAQIGVSVVLLVGAGVFVQSLVAASRADPGFAPDHLVVLQTSFAQAGLSPSEGRVAQEALRERLAGLPGVTGVSFASRLPVGGAAGSSTTVIEGYQPPTGTGAVEIPLAVVDRAYFETLGLPLLAGRPFTGDDLVAGDGIVIVNATMARRFWGRVDVVGERIRPQAAPSAWNRIVGVVGDAKVRTLTEPGTPQTYYPQADAGAPLNVAVIRTVADPAALVAPVRQQVRTVNRALPVHTARSMEDYLGDALAGPRTSAALLSAIALLALFLAATGTHGVVSHIVSQRIPEIGVRIALGADPSRVVRVVLREVTGVVGAAAAVGLALALVASWRLQSVLFGVRVLDPYLLGGVAGVLVLAAALAAWLPARRAARTDPAVTLRSG